MSADSPASERWFEVADDAGKMAEENPVLKDVWNDARAAAAKAALLCNKLEADRAALIQTEQNAKIAEAEAIAAWNKAKSA